MLHPPQNVLVLVVDLDQIPHLILHQLDVLFDFLFILRVVLVHRSIAEAFDLWLSLWCLSAEVEAEWACIVLIANRLLGL